MMAGNIGQAKHTQRQMIAPRNMATNMYRLRTSQKNFTDVIIRTRGGKQLPVHKAALVSASDYFATMFSKAMQKRYPDVVEMKNIAPDALEAVIDFIYDQPIFLSEESIYELTDAAEYLQVADLKTECQKFILASTKPSNCLKHHLYGIRYNMTAVAEKANKIISGNFEKITKKKEFKELNYADLQLLLKKVGKSEEILFSAIVQWAKHDMNGRQNYFDSLFLSIDISLLTSEFIETEVLNEILVKKSSSSVLRVSKELMSRIKLEKSYVEGAHLKFASISTKYHLTHGVHEAQIQDSFGWDDNEGRVWLSSVTQDVFSGTLSVAVKMLHFHASGKPNLIEIFVDVIIGHCVDIIPVANEANQSFEIESLKITNFNYGLGLIPWRIGMFGGHRTRNDAVAFDPDLKEFQNFPQLQFDLMNPVAVRNDEDLYVIEQSTSKVLSLNFKDQMYRWKEVTTMPQPNRNDFKCALLNGFIYVTGGAASPTTFSSVIKYDLTNKVWSDVKSMNERRCHHALVSLEGKLYAIGGWSGNNRLKTVEMYEEWQNKWTFVSSLNKERDILAATAFNGRIYATGGYNGSDLSRVEMYDPNDDVWMMIKELNVPRRWHGSCVVDGKLYVVGGVGVTFIEVYDPYKNEWKICGELDKIRERSAVCAM